VAASHAERDRVAEGPRKEFGEFLHQVVQADKQLQRVLLRLQFVRLRGECHGTTQKIKKERKK
jgi:hypothetical protein